MTSDMDIGSAWAGLDRAQSPLVRETRRDRKGNKLKIFLDQ